METREQLDPGERRRFRSGRDCIDFTHTGGEGEYARWELLHGPADVARWVGLVVRAPQLAVTDADLPAVRELRAALTRAARSVAAGGDPAPADVATINAAAARPPLAVQLAPGADAATLLAGTTSQALATLARDAVDLFAGPHGRRIRVCANETCGLLFVDASRPGTRRWCSMERCGDLAKKRKTRKTPADR